MPDSNDRPRVGRGVPTGGQFKTGHKKPIITLTHNQVVDPSTSQDICTESLRDVADVIDAMMHYGSSLGREVSFTFGDGNNCEIRVWVTEDGSRFQVFGAKKDKDGNQIAVTETESTAGLDGNACKAIMYRLAFELPKISTSESVSRHTRMDYEAVYSDWAFHNFSRDEYEDWRDEYFSLFEALDWRGEGFEPAEAGRWSEHFSASEAHVWSNAGFTAKSAPKWYAACCLEEDEEDSAIAERANEWRKFVPDPVEAGKWIALFGEDPNSSYEWLYHNFTPEEAQQWRKFDPQTARSKLDAEKMNRG